jgi:hypothetical protein
MQTFTYRTFNLSPPEYERQLADALFQIMGKSVHDLPGIVAALNSAGSVPKSGGAWTVESFKAEMNRLGTWTNCTGAPVGAHDVPGITRRANDGQP